MFLWLSVNYNNSVSAKNKHPAIQNPFSYFKTLIEIFTAVKLEAESITPRAVHLHNKTIFNQYFIFIYWVSVWVKARYSLGLFSDIDGPTVNCKCDLGHRLNQILWIIACGPIADDDLSSPHHVLSENTSTSSSIKLPEHPFTWSHVTKSRSFCTTPQWMCLLWMPMCFYIYPSPPPGQNSTNQSASLRKAYLFMWIWLLK